MNTIKILLMLTLLGCGSDEPPTLPSVVGGHLESNPHIYGVVVLRAALDERKGICSGVLVSRTQVLTAAHCLATPQGPIRFVVFANNAFTAGNAVIREIASTKRFGSRDVLLVNFREPAPATYRVQRLARTKPNSSAVKLIGYGRSAAANAASTGTVRAIDARLPFFESVASFFYTQASRGGACYGDSGGPALVRGEAGYEVLGVLSSGSRDCSGYDQYTSVVPIAAELARELR